MQLTYQQAAALDQAALAKATEINVSVSAAVVDSGRELLAFARQDGAPLLSAEVARGKASTSRSLNMPTSQVGPLTQPGGPLYCLEVSSHHRLVSFAGGQPSRSTEWA
ncbi:MAG: heme-binding protein [Brevibacterium sp.]|nr:heme-binding protein [Brevibacterium sp.]MDN6122332.1 heme-binding protein [Brevibacterium sp.]